MSHHFSRGIALLAAALLAAPTLAQDDSDLPKFIQKEMRKEARKIRYEDVSILDGQFEFRVAGKIISSEQIDGGWYFSSNIKAGAPVECALFNDDIDIASTLSNISDINIEANAEANGAPLADKRIYRIDAGHINGSPYISLEWLFTLGEGAQKVAGFTKSSAANVNDVTLVCSHNYFGYRETFTRIFEEFVGTAKTPSRDMPPYYEEIVLESIGDMNVGFAQIAYARDDEGDSLIRTTTASVYPAGPGGIATSDSATSTWSTPDGAVINAYSADAENGVVMNNMQLDRNDDGDWISTGIFQGKEISYVIDGDIVPLSELGQMQRVDTLFDGDATRTDMQVWLPSADPTGFLTGVIEQTGEDRKATMTLGPLALDAGFDDKGSLTEATINAGANTLMLERIWTNGEL